MASVRPRNRADGTVYYQLQYRIDGRQPSIAFDDYDVALRWRDRFNHYGSVTALEMLAAEQRAADVITLAKAGTEYIDSLTGVEEGTRKRYRRFMANDIEPFFGADLPVTVITEDSVRKWINHLELKVGNAPKTIANKHGYLFGLMEWLTKQGARTNNPCADTRLPRVDQAEMVFLEPDEFAALHAALPERWQLFVSLLVASGLRWGEITALRVGDVDRRRCTITVRRAWKYTGGKRTIGKPKTKKSRRTINVAPELIDELPLSGRPYSSWLFLNDNGDPIQISTFYKQIWVPTIATLADDSADPLNGKRPRIHDLRHTCASWMLDDGIPLGDVQEHLGHESIQTTKDRYGHVSRDAGARAAAAVGSRLPKPSKPTPAPALVLAAAA